MEQEIILRIKHVQEIGDGKSRFGLERFIHHDGYIITTNKQHIRLLFDNLPLGFEHCGCKLIANHSINSFTGAALKCLKVNTRKNLVRSLELDPIFARSVHSIQLFILDIQTSMGLLQFVAFNNCPGIFPHQAHVIAEQLEHSEVL